MPRDAFVLKIQRVLCHPKCSRKVSGLSRNRPQLWEVLPWLWYPESTFLLADGAYISPEYHVWRQYRSCSSLSNTMKLENGKLECASFIPSLWSLPMMLVRVSPLASESSSDSSSDELDWSSKPSSRSLFSANKKDKQTKTAKEELSFWGNTARHENSDTNEFTLTSQLNPLFTGFNAGICMRLLRIPLSSKPCSFYVTPLKAVCKYANAWQVKTPANTTV